MNKIRERETAFTQSGNTRSRLETIKLVHLLFLSSLVGLFSLSTSAAEPINTASKTDSGYYNGSYGKGAYWVTPGLYGSMFSVGSKVKRYFIYSNYQRDPASDLSKLVTM